MMSSLRHTEKSTFSIRAAKANLGLSDGKPISAVCIRYGQRNLLLCVPKTRHSSLAPLEVNQPLCVLGFFKSTKAADESCSSTGQKEQSERDHLLSGVVSSLKKTDQPSSSDKQLANECWIKAVEWHNRGDLDRAVAQFTEAARLDGTRADIVLHLGTALQDSGSLEDAAACYRKVLQLDARNHSALYNLGYICEEQQLFGEAIDFFQEALRVAPDDSDAAINVGNCYMQLDDVARAIETYERVITKDDSCAIGHYNLGSALHARRDLRAAAIHFSKTIKLEPSYADAHFNLGIVYQELGDLNKALDCYEAAAKLDEKLTDAAYAAEAIKKSLDKNRDRTITHSR